MSALTDPYPSLHRISDELALRVALVYQGAREPANLRSILIRGGLPPNAGVLPILRADELAANPPHAAILAADLARSAGLSTVRALRRDAQATRIVVVARAAKDAKSILARQTLNAGADAFVPEHDAAQALIPAVRAVVAGLICVPHVARRVVAKPAFSHREKQALELLILGMTNRQIADRLYLAESTVKSHLASAFAKLGVRSRKDAAAVLLDPEEGFWAAPRAEPTRRPHDREPLGGLRLDRVSSRRQTAR